ncbi:MAG: ATP-binding cassette domain-containing protein [Solirubrobacterales bacterium]|nr:ATP-binding cassette domain-containing protein [Solirubrobacterales bacterium]
MSSSPERSDNGRPEEEAMLSLESVSAGYGGGDVLKGVSFTVRRGEIMCIVGPNGAGKSTLLATISGTLRPRRGAITFEGHLTGGLAAEAHPGQGNRPHPAGP